MKVWLSRIRWRLAFWIPGIGLFWIGRSAHSTPALLIGFTALLASVLPWPWTAETYRNRLFRIGNRWADTVGVAHRELQQRRRTRTRELAALSVPRTLTDAHGYLLDLENGRDGRDRPLAERTTSWVERTIALERALQSLQATAETEQERTCVQQIHEHLCASEDDYMRMVATTEQALSQALIRLERLHVPLRMNAHHAEICLAYRDHLAAWHSYHQAVLARDLSAALRAVGRLDTTTSALDLCHTAIDN